MSTPSPRPARIPAPISTRTETAFAICGLVFAVLSWVINPWFLTTVVGIGFSIRALVRVRRITGRAHRVIVTLGVIGVVIGVVGLIGSILSLVIRAG